VSVKTNQEVAV